MRKCMNENYKPPLPLETHTPFGRISAVSFIDGERIYFMTDQSGAISMIPADALEELVEMNK